MCLFGDHREWKCALFGFEEVPNWPHFLSIAHGTKASNHVCLLAHPGKLNPVSTPILGVEEVTDQAQGVGLGIGSRKIGLLVFGKLNPVAYSVNIGHTLMHIQCTNQCSVRTGGEWQFCVLLSGEAGTAMQARAENNVNVVSNDKIRALSTC